MTYVPKKVAPGSRPDFSSRTQDGMVDALEANRTEEDRMVVGRSNFPTTNKGNMVYALNNLLVPIPQYGIVKLTNHYDSTPTIHSDEAHVSNTDRETSTFSDDHPPKAYDPNAVDAAGINTPALNLGPFKERVFFCAHRTEDQFGEVIGVAQMPVRPGTVGRFMVEGITQAKIFIDDEEADGMEYAYPTMSDGIGELKFLAVTQRGPFHIIWKEPFERIGTDAYPVTIWALVQLMHVPRPHGITMVMESISDNDISAPSIQVMTFPRIQAYNGYTIDAVEIPEDDEGEFKTTLKNVSGHPIMGFVGWNVSIARDSDGANEDPDTEVKVELLIATSGENDDELIWGSEGYLSSSRRVGQKPSNSAAGWMLVTLDTDQFIKVRLTTQHMDSGDHNDGEEDTLVPHWKGCHLSFYDPGNAFLPGFDVGEGNVDRVRVGDIDEDEDRKKRRPRVVPE